MASVRMTNNIRNNILEKAKNIFESSLIKAKSRLATDYYDRLMTDIYDTDFRSWKVDTWPSEWLINIVGIDIIINNNTAPFKEFKILGTFNKNFTVPYFRNYINYSNTYVHSPFTPSTDLYNEYYEYRNRIEKINIEKKEFSEKIEHILNRCNTLKQFIELWPQGESLIDNEILNKLNEPTKKQEIAKLPDLDLLTNLSSILVKRAIIK